MLLELISGVVAVVASIFGRGEYCGKAMIDPNWKGLQNDFSTKLHGQHLVSDTVLAALQHHYSEDSKPAKALVFFFQGSTGTGKTFVSKMIADTFYKKGVKNEFVRMFYPSIHFPDNSRKTKDWLRNEIVSRVKKCRHSLFIFDEIDEMPEGVLDVIKPYIDFNDEIDKVDYRHTTFIMLRNEQHSMKILETVLYQQKRGLNRKELALEHFENVLYTDAFNSKGGLSKSNLITRSLISAFVPFLPLEQAHVIKCIRDKFKEYNQVPSQKVIDQILRDHKWIPGSKGKDKFSEAGCKLIEAKAKIHRKSAVKN